MGAGERWASLGVAASVVAGGLAFWAFDALPFQDLPGHAGFIQLRHMFEAWTELHPYLVLAPHLGPYSLFRALGALLVAPLGPEAAVRALATLPLIATPVALAWARARLHGDGSATAAYLGVALSFGFLTLLGFASYLLAVAGVLVALTLWLELLDAAEAGVGTRWRGVGVGLVAVLLVVAHGFAFLVFALLAVSSALATGDRARRIACLRTLAPSFALAGWAAYRERASALPAGSVDAKNPALTAYFQGPLDKLSLLATPTLMTRWGLDALVGVLLWLVLSAAVLETERGLRRERLTRDKADPPDRHARALLVCLAVLAVAFLALPHAIGWLAFVDGRLVPVLLFVGILSVRRASLRPWVRRAQDRAAPVAAWAMVAIVLVASRWFQAEALGFREVLLRVPAGAKLLHLPIDPDSDVFTAHPFLHYDKLILTERPVLVSDAWFHQGTGVYPTAANPSTRLPPSYVASDLRVVDWPAYRLEDWDYILVRTRPAAPAPAVPVALTLVVHEGGFWLFRVAPGPSFVTYSAERP